METSTVQPTSFSQVKGPLNDMDSSSESSSDDMESENHKEMHTSEKISKMNINGSPSSDCKDGEDVHYICTIAKAATSIPVSVIRLAPPSTCTERQSVIKLNSPNYDLTSEKNQGPLEFKINRTSVSSHSPTNDEIRIQCNLCGKRFTQQRNYNYHMAQHNGSQLFACTCPVCGKSYRNKGYLSNHLKIHRNEKEYRCEWCSKSFNQRVAYNTHIRVHTGYCPHKCPLCDKAFSRKTVLTSHIRTHTGEKPFKCTVCEKTFVDKSNMLTHQRLHTGEKPFRCHICGKAFTQRNHLKTHINYHIGIKPYHCTKCNARFSQSSNLKMHSLKCTGILRAGPVARQESTAMLRKSLDVLENIGENSIENQILHYNNKSPSGTIYKDNLSRVSSVKEHALNFHLQPTTAQKTLSVPSRNSQDNVHVSSERWSSSLLAQRLLGK